SGLPNAHAHTIIGDDRPERELGYRPAAAAMLCPHCHADPPLTSGRCVSCSQPLPDSMVATVASPALSVPETLSDSPTISSGSQGVAASSPGGALSPGDVLAGRYGIELLLGSGGMGAFYGAFDAELGVPGALKTIRSQILADPQ